MKNSEVISLPKCDNPQIIRNRYTGQVLTIPCGNCHQCLVTRTQHHSLMCSLHENDYKYTLFVTLTYSPAFVPLCSVYKFKKDDVIHYHLVNKTDRLFPSGKLLYSFDNDIYNEEKLSKLLDKINLNGNIPYTTAYDCQLFLKRLRYYLSHSNCHEKISYYAVSEYGPQTFRPHWHLLLYCNTEPTLQALRKNLSKAWTYGRIDFSLSRGKCSTYLAGYLNSFSSLPSFYAHCFLRPRQLHSIYFSKRYFKDNAFKVYEDIKRGIISTSRPIGNQLVSIQYSSSLISNLFPRCACFHNKNYAQIYSTYKLYESYNNSYKNNKDLTCSEIAKLIVLDIQNGLHNKHSLIISLSPFLLKYHGDYNSLDEDYKIRFYNNVYNLLITSKHFKDICQTYGFSSSNFISLIKRFYSLREYKSLTEWYSYQERLFKDNFDINKLFCLYDNIPFDNHSSYNNNYVDILSVCKPLFSPLSDNWKDIVLSHCCYNKRKRILHSIDDYIYQKSRLEQSYLDSHKHKALNDLNYIFV